MGLLFLIGLVPVIIGMDLGDLATICLFPGAITKCIVNICALSVPSRFKKEWTENGNMAVSLYRALLIISCAASIVLGIFYFVSNDLKGAMIIVTLLVFAYGWLCNKFGHITIHVKEEYKENN